MLCGKPVIPGGHLEKSNPDWRDFPEERETKGTEEYSRGIKNEGRKIWLGWQNKLVRRSPESEGKVL